MGDWQSLWHNSAKGRTVFEIIPIARQKRVQGNFYLNQVFTGHGAMVDYQHKFFRQSPAFGTWSGPMEGANSWFLRRARCREPGPGFSTSLIGGCCRGTDHQFSRAFVQGVKINPELPYCPESGCRREGVKKCFLEHRSTRNPLFLPRDSTFASRR
ncbi:hypothetical protein CDAR_208091 [Caerostris darwini]|uniref:Uncharacterized protein n=1 Tax=Caerostris darwini TaxID=1538125 RepID=A0AAV4W781_9ARAC|nr:hypothetical protein CDAR_208091 [Caerostris darwini]